MYIAPVGRGLTLPNRYPPCVAAKDGEVRRDTTDRAETEGENSFQPGSRRWYLLLAIEVLQVT